jgi:hypothetical protein
MVTAVALMIEAAPRPKDLDRSFEFCIGTLSQLIEQCVPLALPVPYSFNVYRQICTGKASGTR